jgi:hypothetical protein
MNSQTLKIPKTGTVTIAPSSPGRAETNLMNPPTLEIQTTRVLAATCASKNVIPKSINCVVPRFTCASAPLVHMVVIELTIIIHGGKKVAMMPSPTMLSFFALVLACFTHANALCNEEEGVWAFEKVVRSFLSLECFFSHLHAPNRK